MASGPSYSATGQSHAAETGRDVLYPSGTARLQNAPGALFSPAMGAPWLTIVVPAYNEQEDIGAALAAIRTWAAATSAGPPPAAATHAGPPPAAPVEADPRALETAPGIELIVVDDGSTDQTGARVQRFAGDESRPEALAIHLLQHAPNRGKGYAVRQGVLAAGGELVLLCDADLSVPLEEMDRLRPWLAQGYDVVIGSRDMPGARLDPPQPLTRRLGAWVFRACRRRLLLPGLRDTQCGFKLFTARAAREIFRRATVDGFLFDCEVLAIAAGLGFRTREVGVTWRNRPVSRVHPWSEALRALPVLWQIRRRWGRGVEPRC